jgi:hypothetical protein
MGLSQCRKRVTKHQCIGKLNASSIEFSITSCVLKSLAGQVERRGRLKKTDEAETSFTESGGEGGVLQSLAESPSRIANCVHVHITKISKEHQHCSRMLASILTTQNVV